MPKDNNSFLYLDISGLKPASYKVTLVDSAAAASAAAASAAD